ncbi:MAG: hypothetical protein H7Y10_08405 [Flavobacterium sp.]|nr:hypothetical protein [Flavobacterium sp.]
MRLSFICFLILFCEFFSYGQIIRNENESAEMFANRIKPDSTIIVHTVFEMKQLDTSKNVIIAFYEKTIYEVKQMDTYVDRSEYKEIDGIMYVPISVNQYKKIAIGSILADGGDPEIISVFFANADKDKNKELIVLSKIDQRHYDYGGAFYETYIFDYSKAKNEFKYLDKLSELFWGCECGWREGRKEKAKYKTASEIKAKLKKMGYNYFNRKTQKG